MEAHLEILNRLEEACSSMTRDDIAEMYGVTLEEGHLIWLSWYEDWKIALEQYKYQKSTEPAEWEPPEWEQVEEE